MGSTTQGIPALKAGSVDAFTTTPPYDLFAQRLGFKVILDITALKIPFAATVLLSTRPTVPANRRRSPSSLALRRSDSYFPDPAGSCRQGRAKIHPGRRPGNTRPFHGGSGKSDGAVPPSRPQRNRAHSGIDQKNRAPGSVGQSRRLLRCAIFHRAARQRISKTAERGKILKTQASRSTKASEKTPGRTALPARPR